MIHRWTRKVIITVIGSLITWSALAEDFAVPGGVITLEWGSDFSSDERSVLKQWLAKATHTASQLAGTFPRESSRVVIERASSRRRGTSRSAVPWGQTIRSGIEGVLFQVNTEIPLQEFINDWTAAHEFSHLFIPYPGQRDIWLSEGFASYYQNILMAREGLLTERQAWQKLYNGFVRAEKDRNPERTLSEVSEGRRRYRSTMRVYWSGALFFLEADIALRLASNNQRSLDWVLDQFVNCCRDQQKSWNGEQMLASFDAIVGDESGLENLFSELYEHYSQSSSIPDSRPLLARIGIAIRDEEVMFVDNAPLKIMREDFTKARKTPLAHP